MSFIPFQRSKPSSGGTWELLAETLNVPVLARLPHLERRASKGTPKGPARSIPRRVDPDGRWRSRLLVHFAALKSAWEPYYVLAERLQSPGTPRTVLSMAGREGEGSSIACVNLALAAARTGRKVLVVEAHVHEPRISGVLHLLSEPGLSGVIRRGRDWRTAIQRSGDLHVLPAGRSVARPATLWRHPVAAPLLRELKTAYDLVVLDGAPLARNPEMLELAAQVDATMLVCQHGRGVWEGFADAVEQLRSLPSRFEGIVLNDLSA